MRIRYLFFFIGFLLSFPQSTSAYSIIGIENNVGAGFPRPNDDKGRADRAPTVLRVVFCPLHYENNADFLKDTGIMTRKLFQVRPFSEFEGRIAFSYLELSPEEQSRIFKPVSAFPPLLARRDFIDGLSEKIGAVYKLVIIDAKGGQTCAELSRIDKASLLIIGRARYNSANSFAKGFLHELGHSLGLRDEFIDSAHNLEPGYPNCAVTKKEAQEWWGDLVGRDSRVNYISGCCGNRSYIRPTIASLMNDADKAEDFGPVNERYLREALIEDKRNF